MRSAVFHPEADEEFIAAARFYERHAEGLGREFIAEVRHTVRRIVAHPESGTRFSRGLRRTSKGLPKKSWVKISQIRTLSVERIGARMARATPEDLAQVVEGLDEFIGT